MALLGIEVGDLLLTIDLLVTYFAIIETQAEKRAVGTLVWLDVVLE